MWGIGEEGWIQLWSGFIGSVVGAIAAALVALLVVWLTNRHQTLLAKRATDQQAELFQKQLEEQRAALDSQLAHQQETLKRQLDEQRLEARRERERSAMATIVSGVVVLKAESRTLEFDHRREVALMAAGVHRWRLELGADPLAEELALWPNLIWRAHLFAYGFHKKHRLGAERARKLYVMYLDFLREICMRWSSIEFDEYGHFLNELADLRLEFDARKAKVEDYNRADADEAARNEA